MSESTKQGFCRNYGTDPQSLVSQIVRDRIYSSRIWKEQCFALNAETILDVAKGLDAVGFCYGGYSRPTEFLCLLMKLLQISPSLEIVRAYLEFSDGRPSNDPLVQVRDLRYMRALTAVYVRIVALPHLIYTLLEPLLSDYRKLFVLDSSGEYIEIRMDELIANLLDENNDSLYGFHLPTIPRRKVLEAKGTLEQYKSILSV